MNKEEVRHFKLFANRTNEREERKDVQLFDSIRRTYPEYDEDRIMGTLYGGQDKNSLYRLKNRLLASLGKSISLQYFDHNEANQVLNCLALARLFQGKGQVSTAYYYLGKAEKKAVETEALDLLELVYSELIRLSYETLEIDPGHYIAKRKENREKLNKIQEIDDVLASVIYSVKTLQSFSGKNMGIVQLLKKKVNALTNSSELRDNPQLRFKIYEAVSRILLQKEDFVSLENYLLSTYDEYSKEKLFNKNNHDTKLQMLTYLINALFKNGKYDESLRYGEVLKKAMGEFGGFLSDKYLFYYYNSQVNNYSKIDVNRSIELLNEAKDHPVIRKHPYHIVFVYLNLSVSNFDKGNFREALRCLVKPSLHDTYKVLDEGFRYRIAVVELIIRFELEDLDYIEHRTKQIKKQFQSLFRNPAYSRPRTLMSVIGRMMGPHPAKDRKLAARVKELLNGPAGSADHDIINYNDWLQNKMKGWSGH